MAIPGYMYLKNESGKIIKGSVAVKDREGSVEVIGLHHNVSFNADTMTGRVLEKRQHRPFLIEKEIDASSVLLYKALSSGETLSEAKLELYRINDNGQEDIYFEITLEKVKIVTLFSLMHDIKKPDYERYGHLELVQLRYGKITWRYIDGNIVHSDDWDIRIA